MNKEAEVVETELLPCPFCGCRFFKGKLTYLGAPTDGSGNKFFQYKCPKCRTQFAVTAKTEAEAVQLWNTRTSADYIRTQALELEPLSDEELRNRIAFHQVTTEKLQSELCKVWRMRIRTGHASDEDRERAARIVPSLFPEKVDTPPDQIIK